MVAGVQAWYALAFESGLTPSGVSDLLEKWRRGGGAPEPERLLESGETAWRGAGLTAEHCAALAEARAGLGRAEDMLAQCREAGVACIPRGDALYPASFESRLLRAAPPLLFALGNRDLLSEPAVSVIGSRRPTAESLSATARLSALLAREGVVVVSGYAEGIDRQASEAALELQGATILVLAQGLLTFTQARSQLSAWIDQGRLLALSAFAPRSEWQTPQAMARNAMITALGAETLVGEARDEGGAWEAARMALRQGRRVWVRDSGRPDSGHAGLERLGAHRLPWPDDDFEEWCAGRVEEARREKREENSPARLWTEAEAARLLREGSGAEIHDACGLTGALLTRILEGRGAVALTTLADLRKIRGLGPGAVEELYRVFGIESPTRRETELPLFPEIEEFPGWDGELAATPSAGTPSPPETSPERQEEILEALGGGAPAQGEAAALATSKKSDRPRRNLILVLAPSLRRDFLACYGGPAALTPNLTRLAESGVVVERAVSISPQGAPARASLLTGLFPHQHGLACPGMELGEGQSTLATALAAAQYRTACFGRPGLSPAQLPAKQRGKESLAYWESGLMERWSGPYHGFNQVGLTLGAGHESLRGGHYAQWLEARHSGLARKLRGGSRQAAPSGYLGAWALPCPVEQAPEAWIAEQADAYLEANREQPFFLCLAPPGPGAPYGPLEEDLEAVGAECVPPLRAGATEGLPEHYAEAARGGYPVAGLEGAQLARDLNPTQLEDIRRHYAAQLRRFDRSLGSLLDSLERHGLRERSVVALTADRGELLGEAGLVGDGPFAPGCLLEVPLLFSAPGLLPEGSRVAGLFSSLDLCPTLCALLEVEAPDIQQGLAQDRELRQGEALGRRRAPFEALGAFSGSMVLKGFADAAGHFAYYPLRGEGELRRGEEDGGESFRPWGEIACEERVALLEALCALGAWAENPGLLPPDNF